MTDVTHTLELAGLDAAQGSNLTHSDLDYSWLCANARPVDLDGPTDIPFDRFGDDAIQSSIVSRFQAIAGRYATRIAIDDGKTRLTYAEVRRIICHLARRVETVVPAGRPVAIVLPNAALFPVAALACLAVGRPYVPIDLDYPTARNAEILREAGAAAAIIQSGLPAASALVPTSLPSIDITEPLYAPDEPPLDPVDTGGPAIILFTSGSTGRPKGICHAAAADSLVHERLPSTCRGSLHPAQLAEHDRRRPRHVRSLAQRSDPAHRRTAPDRDWRRAAGDARRADQRLLLGALCLALRSGRFPCEGGGCQPAHRPPRRRHDARGGHGAVPSSASADMSNPSRLRVDGRAHGVSMVRATRDGRWIARPLWLSRARRRSCPRRGGWRAGAGG